MLNRFFVVAAGLISCISVVFGQNVIVNSPTAWVTQRSDSITVRVQVDTASVKQRIMAVKLKKVNGQKSRVISSKKFKITDYSNEFSFGKIKRELVGGNDYLKIEWSIPGSDLKGSVFPIGIVALEKIDTQPVLKAQFIEENDLKKAVSGIKKDQFFSIGDKKFAFVWNNEALFIVTESSQDSTKLEFIMDGKNGKNAFLSFPDRVISCKAESVETKHYTREVKEEALLYSEKKWLNEISNETIGDKQVIKMPWADAGIIPFEKRLIGVGAFVLGPQGQKIVSIPQDAVREIPGTWTNLVLLK